MIDNPSVAALFAAVRRRLLRSRLLTAARQAAWGTAALALLAAAIHAAVHPLGPAVLVAGLAACWAAALAWAVSRRAAERECALWADRHLGGASAFTTLLDIVGRPRTDSDEHATRWLLHWAVARVPHALALLGARADPARLARPLAASVICTALAVLALALPGRRSTGPSFAAAPLAAPASPSSPSAPPLAAAPRAQAQQVAELAQALRGAQSPDAAARPEAEKEAGRGPQSAHAAAPGTGQSAAQSATADTSAKPAAGNPSTPGRHDAARSAIGRTGAATGRDPGASADDRADVGVSRPQPGSFGMRRSLAPGSRSADDTQADPEQSATYADGDGPRGGAATWFEPAAATPPPATPSNRLGAAEASYLQAWTRANAHPR